MNFGCRLIASLIILMLLINWESGYLMFQIITSDTLWKIFVFALGASFFALNLVSATGLFLNKRWAFWLTYIAVVFTTIFFSIPYIPLITKLFPHNIRYIPLIVGNLIVLAFTAYLHVLSRKINREK